MAKGYVLYYAGEPVCASKNKDLIVLYLFQKGMMSYEIMRRYYEIKRVPKNEIFNLFDEYYLQEDLETGFVIVPEDREALNRRFELQKDNYKETLYGLEAFKDLLKKKKDKKKLEDAIEILKKRKDILAGSIARANMLADILKVPVENIIEERELFRQFYQKVHGSD